MSIRFVGDEIHVNTITGGAQMQPGITHLSGGRYVVTWYGDGSGDGTYEAFARVFNADGTPAGDEFVVNSVAGVSEFQPNVAELADGRFVIAWHTDASQIQARLFESDGTAAGDEFSVGEASVALGFGNQPAVVALGDGGFAVGWTAYTATENGADHDIYGRAFDAAGNPTTDAFVVNTTTANDQSSPSAALLNDGRVVAIWQSFEDGDFDVRGRIYNPDGFGATDFVVNVTTGYFQGDPFVAALQNGRFLVSWEAYDDNTNSYDIHGQLFDVHGNPRGGNFVIADEWPHDAQPTIASLADGRFVVAWYAEHSPEDGTERDIRGRVFEADSTPVGESFLINTTATDVQASPAITALADGSFVVSWQSGETGDWDIRAQRMEVDVPPRAEFVVNSTTESHQIEPNVTTLSDGRFVVSYTSAEEDGTWSIRARLFAADGTPIGDDFRVSYADTQDRLPSMAALDDGGFIVAWQHETQDNGWDLMGQRFAADGTRLGSAFVVNTTLEGEQQGLSLASLDGGRFVATWYGDGATDGTYEISARIFEADGTPAGDAFTVNTRTGSYEYEPSVAALSDGRFVVTWHYSDFGAIQQGRIFDADGVPAGDAFDIADTSPLAQDYRSSITALADGGFLVTWDRHLTGPNDGLGEIYARFFDAAGNPTGAEFLVNTMTAGDQTRPSVTALDDGRIMVSWLSETAGTYVVEVRLFNTDGSPAGDDIAVNTAVRVGTSTLSVAPLSNGHFIVTWEAKPGDHEFFDIYAVILGDQGVTVTSDAAHIIGGDEDDVLTGLDHANMIEGLGGNDTLSGGGGGDTLLGGDGDDLLAGGRSSDIINGGDGDDTVLYAIGEGHDAIDGGEGTDSLIVTGTADADMLMAVFDGTVLTRVHGNMLTSVEDVTADMLDGSDTLAYLNTAAGVAVDLALGTASGFAGISDIENVTGGAGDDALAGDAGANVLKGGAGNDLLTGAAGDDLLIGGGGCDTASYAGEADAMQIDLASGTTARNGVLEDTLSSIEDALGGAGDDIILGSNGINTLNGGAGDDVLSGGGGSDALIGGEGDDALQGDAGYDTLTGGDGDDALSGGQANDIIEGGAGDDSVLYAMGDGADAISGGDGSDELQILGTADADRLDVIYDGASITGIEGGTVSDVETITADLADGADLLSYAGSTAGVTVDLSLGRASGFASIDGIEHAMGGSGDDMFVGDEKANSFAGGLGDDTYVLAMGDTACEAADGGIDHVLTTSGEIVLASNLENLTYTGTGDFTGTGNSADNVITGGAGNDVLTAKGGDDTLVGGIGDDHMKGGSGSDRFVFAPGFGNDTITRFDADADGDHDILDITGFGITGADFAARVDIADLGSDTLVTVDGGDTVRLLHVNGTGANRITMDDFLLA